MKIFTWTDANALNFSFFFLLRLTQMQKEKAGYWHKQYEQVHGEDFIEAANSPMTSLAYLISRGF